MSFNPRSCNPRCYKILQAPNPGDKKKALSTTSTTYIFKHDLIKWTEKPMSAAATYRDYHHLVALSIYKTDFTFYGLNW